MLLTETLVCGQCGQRRNNAGMSCLRASARLKNRAMSILLKDFRTIGYKPYVKHIVINKMYDPRLFDNILICISKIYIFLNLNFKLYYFVIIKVNIFQYLQKHNKM